MNLYTFIMNFRGGIYIDQVLADDINTACIKWSQSINPQNIKFFGDKLKQKLIQDMNEEIPTKIIDRENVWCIGAILNNSYALINIVKTEIPPLNRGCKD